MSKKRPEHRQALTRRDFFRLGGTAGAGYLAGSWPRAASGATDRTTTAPKREAMPTRNLGRTGHQVCLFSLGGQAAIEQANNADRAVPLIERALDLGVNYIDTAAWYGGEERWSQRHVGQVMKHRRDETFLATKTHDRTRDGSLRLLEESLRLLQTDHIDLWQIHNLSRMEQVEAIFASGGAMAALRQAREQKIVRFLGVTGHADPAVLMEALRRFEFDTLLLAVNAADAHHRSFAAELLPMAVERQMGIIAMKVPARGRLLAPSRGDGAESKPTAQAGHITMRQAFDYVLSLPVSTAIIGCDSIEQLEENVTLARTFTPLSAAQLASLSERTRPIAEQALFFRRWT